ncbi:MAG TPA: nicotinamide-nucleotide amidohydrolase family protein [Chryseolinea sp.]
MYDDKTILEIRNILLKNNYTIAVAESVTAGHLQVAFASAENASQFFQGGLTAYNLGQKARHLKIEPIHAEQCNCVSDKVAITMAHEVTHLFSSDWGIAITGYAAPMPECSIDELFAHYAISFRQTLIRVQTINARIEHPMKVQAFYVNTILTAFHELLRDQSSFSKSDLNSISSRFASAGPFSTSPSIE